MGQVVRLVMLSPIDAALLLPELLSALLSALLSPIDAARGVYDVCFCVPHTIGRTYLRSFVIGCCELEPV